MISHLNIFNVLGRDDLANKELKSGIMAAVLGVSAYWYERRALWFRSGLSVFVCWKLGPHYGHVRGWQDL